jgi:hypothetical protein
MKAVQNVSIEISRVLIKSNMAIRQLGRTKFLPTWARRYDTTPTIEEAANEQKEIQAKVLLSSREQMAGYDIEEELGVVVGTSARFPAFPAQANFKNTKYFARYRSKAPWDSWRSPSKL